MLLANHAQRTRPVEEVHRSTQKGRDESYERHCKKNFRNEDIIREATRQFETTKAGRYRGAGEKTNGGGHRDRQPHRHGSPVVMREDLGKRWDVGHVDLPRLGEGGMHAPFFALWVPIYFPGAEASAQAPGSAGRRIELATTDDDLLCCACIITSSEFER